MEIADLEKMTDTELREYALKNHPDVTGVDAMKKEELIAAIQKATGGEVKETPKKKGEEEKPGAKVKIEKKALKQQIRQLRSEKDKLLPSKDKKALHRLRKKIKRFRRLTKKAG
jgi:CHAD domain-containing protein